MDRNTPATTCWNLLIAIGIVSYVSPLSKVIQSIFNIDSPTFKVSKPAFHVNTTQFVVGIEEIGKLVEIDYTPMYHLSTSINKATSLVRKMKHKATYALSKTDINSDFATELMRFFDEIADELTATEQVADEANVFYHQQKAQLSTIRYLVTCMKRRINKSKISDAIQSIEDIIIMVDQSIADLTQMKRKLLQQKKNMEAHQDISGRYVRDIYKERDESERVANDKVTVTVATGMVAATAATYFVNPVIGIGAALIGSWQATAMQHRKEATLLEFEQAALMFDETSVILDNCIEGISMIVNNLNSIAGNLREIPKSFEKLIYELGKMEGKAVIYDDEIEELNAKFDAVIHLVTTSQQKYHGDSHTSNTLS